MSTTRTRPSGHGSALSGPAGSSTASMRSPWPSSARPAANGRKPHPHPWLHGRMHFLVLGPLRAMAPDGRDLTPRGQRTLDLLAALLVRRRQPVEPQALLELVWGDEAIHLDVSAVHTVVARLRRALGADAVQTTPRGYQVSPSWRVDEDHFASSVADARRLGDATGAAEAYESALTLWRTTHAYDEVNETLVAAERSRLAELRDNAREALAQALLDTGTPGDAERALAEAETLIGADPLRERAHEIAMLANARLGRQADALAAYTRLRTLLRDELGIDPGPRAVALHERILAQDLTPVAVPESAPRRSLAPTPLTPLIDRERDLDQVLGTLAERRLVTLLGPGGVGKSRLLAEACHRLAATGADVAYADLSCLDDADDADVRGAIGQALALGHGDEADSTEGLASAIGARELTLCLDEAERALEATAAVLGELVRACPRLRVLVTSRRPLDVVGERQQLVGPLDCPAADATPEEVRRAPATRLLIERLRDHVPGLEPTEDESRHLGRLSRRVDGLPLALELLARHADTRSLTDLERATDSLLDLTGSPDRPERHRSLRDTVLWSAAALPADQRRILRSLGVFAGPFDTDAATAVVGRGVDVPAGLRALTREALVQVQRGPGALRLRLLSVVRELALEGLAQADELAATRARHRRWYADRWRAAPRSDDLLRDVRDGYADFLQALRTAIDDRDAETVADLAIALARFWAFADLVGPGRRWLARALDSGLLSDVERARVLVMRGVVTLHADPAGSLADLEAARPVLEAAGDDRWLLTVHNNLALHHLTAGRVPAATVAATAAAGYAHVLGDERRADTLSILALSQSIDGSTQARATIDTAWTLALESGSVATLETVTNNVFLALVQLGDHASAATVLSTLETRLPSAERPPCIVLVEGWNHLLAERPLAALAGFAQARAIRPERVADAVAAECYYGAGLALAALADPVGVALLAGAEELALRVGSTLQPWQRRLVAAATDGVPSARPPVPQTTTDLGTRLAGLLEDAASTAARAAPASASADVSGSGS